jgi:uncharacterized protein
MDGEALVSSEALVVTDRPARYGKQLVAHLGRYGGGEWSDNEERGWIQFTGGRAEVACVPDGLRLSVEAGADDLDRLQDVVGWHLIRFGAKDELAVSWSRS